MSNKLLLIKLVELWKAHQESAMMARADASAMPMAFSDSLEFHKFREANTKQVMAAIEELLTK